MQSLIESINLIGGDIDHQWRDTCFDKFDAILKSSSNKEAVLISSLGRMIQRIKETIYKFDLSNSKEDQTALVVVKDNMERHFYYRLISNFINEYEFYLDKCPYDENTFNANLNDLAGLFRLVSYSSDERNQKSVLIQLFIMKTITMILSDLIKYRVKMSRFTRQSVDFIFGSFEIQFHRTFFTSDEYRYRDALNSFSAVLAAFIGQFEGGEFFKNIFCFQRLAE